MARVKIMLTCTKCGKEFEHIHTCNNSAGASSYTEWAKDNITFRRMRNGNRGMMLRWTGLQRLLPLWGTNPVMRVYVVAKSRFASPPFTLLRCTESTISLALSGTLLHVRTI